MDRFTTLYVDEYTPLHVLSQMRPSRAHFNPHYFTDPTFFYYQVGAALKIGSTLGLIRLAPDQTYYLKHVAEFARLYLAGRFAVVLYGLAVIVVIFLLGRHVTGTVAGAALPAFFYAVIPLAVISCDVIDVGVPVSFWLGLTFMILLCDSMRHWHLAALCAGLALSTKYTALPILLPCWWAGTRLRLSARQWSGGGLLAILGFLVGTPYALVDAPRFLHDLGVAASMASSTQSGMTFKDFLHPMYHYFYGVGIALTVVSVIGLVDNFIKRQPAAILSALFLVPYFMLLGRSQAHVARYINETMPFLLPFAGLPFLWLWRQKSWVKGLAVFIFVLCFSRAPYTFALDRSLASEMDPRDQASRWIREHVPADSLIGLDHEADFMSPGILYMRYWKGSRYPAQQVTPPDYRFAVWDQKQRRWPARIDYWVGSNLYYSGLGRKDMDAIARVTSDRLAMQKGYRLLARFTRHLQWGPFHYDLDREAGWDWIIFQPEVLIYGPNA